VLRGRWKVPSEAFSTQRTEKWHEGTSSAVRCYRWWGSRAACWLRGVPRAPSCRFKIRLPKDSLFNRPNRSSTPRRRSMPAWRREDPEPAEGACSERGGRRGPPAAATTENGGESFDGVLATVREAREPFVLFALEKLGRSDHYPELKEARADPERRAIMAGA